MANNKINVTDLDFDQIKNNLKKFFRGQSEFTDYDFEGSALSTLLDILAYNTHYQGLYYNLAVNESFLDSASKRSSVVSKANELGYTPKSITGSKAIVNIVMINSSLSAPQFIEIPAYTPFVGSIDGVTYTFYTIENHISQKKNLTYSFNNILIQEGYPLTYRYIIDSTNKQSLIIPNTNVDLNTIRVRVQPNAEISEFSTYTISNDILTIDGDSKVFFVHELQSGQYELQFGNDIVGKALQIGNIVTVDYFTCKGSMANGIRSFEYKGPLVNSTTVSTLAISPSFGGSEPETIDEIKINAPRAYTTQNRCVTAQDYESIILRLFNNARAVRAWGGQENKPPQFGKVFVSVIPEVGNSLTQVEKDFILNDIILPRKSLTTSVELVDANYIKLQLNTTVYYDPRSTTLSSGDIQSLVKQTVQRYNDQYLNTFGGIFKFSKFGAVIDGSESSITSNITTVLLRREIQPVFDTIAGYVVNLGNPILKPENANINSISSTGFLTTDSDQVVFIKDVVTGDGVGILQLRYINEFGADTVVKQIGRVNYTTGLIEIDDLVITGLVEASLDLIIKGESNDVVPIQNQFITIDPTLTQVSVVPDSLLQGYTFTSSQT